MCCPDQPYEAPCHTASPRRGQCLQPLLSHRKDHSNPKKLYFFPIPAPFCILSFRTMETVLAIGLASNVVQFVDFTSKLVHTYNQLRHDAAQSEHEYHRQVTTHLLPIADKIRVSAHDVAQSSNTTSLERKVVLLFYINPVKGQILTGELQ
jgi:hypothetical protein